MFKIIIKFKFKIVRGAKKKSFACRGLDHPALGGGGGQRSKKFQHFLNAAGITNKKSRKNGNFYATHFFGKIDFSFWCKTKNNNLRDIKFSPNV